MINLGTGDKMKTQDGDTQLDLMYEKEIENYWLQLSSSGGMPRRSDVKPREFSSALPFSFLADASRPQSIRFRLVGSALYDLAAYDIRTMPLNMIVGPKSRFALQRILDDVMNQPARATLTLGRNSIPFIKVFIGPLQDEFGQITRLLGGIRPFKPNVSFDDCDDIVDYKISPTTIVSRKFIEPKPKQRMVREGKTSFEHKKTAPHPSERPYLKLIKTT